MLTVAGVTFRLVITKDGSIRQLFTRTSFANYLHSLGICVGAKENDTRIDVNEWLQRFSTGLHNKAR